MKKFILLIILLPLFVLGQNKTVVFQSNMKWENVLSLAKQTGKYIFVDCYATWCQPCVHMEQHVFTEEDVASFINSNFVNWKLQFDQNDKDSDYLQSMYNEAVRFKQEYNILVFPTYLIFDKDGALVHRIVGASDAKSFLVNCKESLDPATQYEALVRLLDQNRGDLQLSKQVLALALKNQDLIRLNTFLKSIADTIGFEILLSDEFKPFIINSARNSFSYSYQFIKNHIHEFDRYLLPQGMSSNLLLSSVLIYENVIPVIRMDNNSEIDFNKLQQSIQNQHPYVDLSSMMDRAKIQYYISKKDWLKVCDAVDSYILSMGSLINSTDLEQFAHIIRNHSSLDNLMERSNMWLLLASSLKSSK